MPDRAAADTVEVDGSSVNDRIDVWMSINTNAEAAFPDVHEGFLRPTAGLMSVSGPRAAIAAGRIAMRRPVR